MLLRGIIEVAEEPNEEPELVNAAWRYLYHTPRDPSLTAETVIAAANARLAAEETRVAARGARW